MVKIFTFIVVHGSMYYKDMPMIGSGCKDHACHMHDIWVPS